MKALLILLLKIVTNFLLGNMDSNIVLFCLYIPYRPFNLRTDIMNLMSSIAHHSVVSIPRPSSLYSIHLTTYAASV